MITPEKELFERDGNENQQEAELEASPTGRYGMILYCMRDKKILIDEAVTIGARHLPIYYNCDEAEKDSEFPKETLDETLRFEFQFGVNVYVFYALPNHRIFKKRNLADLKKALINHSNLNAGSRDN